MAKAKIFRNFHTTLHTTSKTFELEEMAVAFVKVLMDRGFKPVQEKFEMYYKLFQDPKGMRAKQSKCHPPIARKVKKIKVYKERPKSRREIYVDYLQSPEWYAKRQEVFAVRGKKCQKCQTSQHLDVHHASYKNLMKESMDELFVLCRTCHGEFHKIYGSTRLVVRYTQDFLVSDGKPKYERDKDTGVWYLST